MAKLQSYPAITSVASADLLHVEMSSGGSFLTKKITYQNFLTGLAANIYTPVGSAETYTTIGAAIAAGKYLIYLKTGTTETGAITLTNEVQTISSDYDNTVNMGNYKLNGSGATFENLTLKFTGSITANEFRINGANNYSNVKFLAEQSTTLNNILYSGNLYNCMLNINANYASIGFNNNSGTLKIYNLLLYFDTNSGDASLTQIYGASNLYISGLSVNGKSIGGVNETIITCGAAIATNLNSCTIDGLANIGTGNYYIAGGNGGNLINVSQQSTGTFQLYINLNNVQDLNITNCQISRLRNTGGVVSPGRINFKNCKFTYTPDAITIAGNYLNFDNCYFATAMTFTGTNNNFSNVVFGSSCVVSGNNNTLNGIITTTTFTVSGNDNLINNLFTTTTCSINGTRNKLNGLICTTSATIGGTGVNHISDAKIGTTLTISNLSINNHLSNVIVLSTVTISSTDNKIKNLTCEGNMTLGATALYNQINGFEVSGNYTTTALGTYNMLENGRIIGTFTDLSNYNHYSNLWIGSTCTLTNSLCKLNNLHIVGNTTVTSTFTTLTNCTLEGTLTLAATCSNVLISNSIIDDAVTIAANATQINISNCQFNNNITVSGNNNSIDNCIIYAAASTITISGGVTGTQISNCKTKAEIVTNSTVSQISNCIIY